MGFILRIAVLFLIIFILEFYFFKKLSNSTRIVFPDLSTRTISIIKRIVLLMIHVYPALLLLAYLQALIDNKARIQLPENSFIDYAAVYPFWTAVLIIVQSILLLLPIDILKLVFFPVYKKNKQKLKPLFAKSVLAIILFFVIYVPFRIIYDYNNVSIRVKEYKAKDLPQELNKFKIALIGDIQADRYTDPERLYKYISKLNSTHPDLVLIAGDLITSTPDYINIAAEYTGKIKSRYGVYSCVGDHDNWAYRENTEKSIREITEALSKYNVEMIDNGTKIIRVNNADIRITFITNTYVKTLPDAELDKLAKGSNDDDFKILLVHQPRERLVEIAVKHRYNLLLAGHTHGGQVTFLFPFKNLSPTLFETKYVRGDFNFNNMMMTVNRGLGMSLVPLRYNSTPEVTVIVLTKV